ncbi:MAG: 2-isopropylmalate synthase [Gammaproteobacteria bacterium RIFCSPHIGHO2_12_FULL_45_9]|nr:MAG: 2-isopropylmalate synthase [Gammaproteobacteria bacterium RIFCSPHIGHO2_12_FULL_45_9]
MKQPQRIYIFDTTLRDGQQSPGAGMSFEDNVAYADYAELAGIDILEAGFPAASQHDFDIVRTIAGKLAARQSPMRIAALCQLREAQVVRTMEALQAGLAMGCARVHTYVPVDPNLMAASLGQLAHEYARIVEDVYRLVHLAVTAGFEVEFSPEGYSRLQHQFDFTTDVIRAAVSAGACVINCPDTIGGASRWQGESYFVHHMQQHAAIIQTEFPEREIIWSVHCHNDLGLALDNTLTAVFEGPARQIEGCMNGVGERAGNVALEQCVMAIDQFGTMAHPHYTFFTKSRLEKLSDISNFIAEKMLVRQPHWPITGENAARHSSGGHTNAILKNPLAYQPFDPKRVGQEISFVFGPLSGSNHAKDILEKHGFHCAESEKTLIAQSIKDKYADRRKGITDEELIEGYFEYYSPIKVDRLHYARDASGNATVSLSGNFFGETTLNVHCSDGNSALAALDCAVKAKFLPIEIINYHSNACAGGTVNVECNSTVVVRCGGEESFIGKAIDQDIEISALKAYIDAVNQAYVTQHYRTGK